MICTWETFEGSIGYINSCTWCMLSLGDPKLELFHRTSERKVGVTVVPDEVTDEVGDAGRQRGGHSVIIDPRQIFA